MSPHKKRKGSDKAKKFLLQVLSGTISGLIVLLVERLAN